MKYLENQESFSFSSSKTGLSSDGHNQTGDRISDHHQNEYFEIYLPPPPPSPSATKTNHGDAKEEEFEFCFSFNSSSALVDFPMTPDSSSSNHPFRYDKPPMTTTTFATSQSVNSLVEKHNHRNKINNSMTYKHIFRSVNSPKCHLGLISTHNFTPSRLRPFGETQRGLVKNRLGGIKKFMMKLRSIKSMLRSLNASQRLQPSEKVKVNKKNQKTSIDQEKKTCSHMTDKSDDYNNVVADTCSQNRNPKKEKSLRRNNFNGLNKIFDVIMRNIKITRRSKQRDSKNYPVSIKSSPIHDPNDGNAHDERRSSFYSRDHSIQAAITHCKKSLGK